MVYNQPSSPLEHPRDSVDKLLFCADKGIPGIYSPAPLAGGTAPITIAGHVAQGLAEGALRPRAAPASRARDRRSCWAWAPAVLDMATAQSSLQRPRVPARLRLLRRDRQVARPAQLGLRRHDRRQVVDAQAGVEIARAHRCSACCVGSNLNHDVGYIDFGLTGSFEQIVIMAEFIALNRRLLAGIEVTPETLALDVIAEAGPGGDFLSKRHTARATCAAASGARTLFNRMSHERWLEDGGPRPDARRHAARAGDPGRARAGAARRRSRGAHRRLVEGFAEVTDA